MQKKKNVFSQTELEVTAKNFSFKENNTIRSL